MATPEPFNVPAPILVLPSKNDTLPAGVPAPALTVAVNVTKPPASAGFCDEEIWVEVLAVLPLLAMTWERTLEVLPVEVLFPPKTAVME